MRQTLPRARDVAPRPIARATIAREALERVAFRDQPPFQVGLKIHARKNVGKFVRVSGFARPLHEQMHDTGPGGRTHDSYGFRSAGKEPGRLNGHEHVGRSGIRIGTNRLGR